MRIGTAARTADLASGMCKACNSVTITSRRTTSGLKSARTTANDDLAAGRTDPGGPVRLRERAAKLLRAGHAVRLHRRARAAARRVLRSGTAGPRPGPGPVHRPGMADRPDRRVHRGPVT